MKTWSVLALLCSLAYLAGCSPPESTAPPVPAPEAGSSEHAAPGTTGTDGAEETIEPAVEPEAGTEEPAEDTPAPTEPSEADEVPETEVDLDEKEE